MLLLLDTRKAFDTVSSDIMMAKLKKYGVNGKELSFVESYMNNRVQTGLVGDETSEEMVQLMGCPQGGSLSCISFILYNNDCPLAVPEAKTVMYSDDTTLILDDIESYCFTSKSKVGTRKNRQMVRNE